MAKKKAKKKTAKKISRTATKRKKKSNLPLAIVALILNILIIPGLGSIIGGKTKAGIWQLIIAVIGAFLSLIIIGIPILIAAWIWGILTGIKLIQEAH
jgi:TM2 domain-containing membrane protein YozV